MLGSAPGIGAAAEAQRVRDIDQKVRGGLRRRAGGAGRPGKYLFTSLDPAVIEEVERRVRAGTRQQRQPKADHGKRIGQLTREVSNLTDAIWRSATGD